MPFNLERERREQALGVGSLRLANQLAVLAAAQRLTVIDPLDRELIHIKCAQCLATGRPLPKDAVEGYYFCSKDHRDAYVLAHPDPQPAPLPGP